VLGGGAGTLPVFLGRDLHHLHWTPVPTLFQFNSFISVKPHGHAARHRLTSTSSLPKRQQSGTGASSRRAAQSDRQVEQSSGFMPRSIFSRAFRLLPRTTDIHQLDGGVSATRRPDILEKMSTGPIAALGCNLTHSGGSRGTQPSASTSIRTADKQRTRGAFFHSNGRRGEESRQSIQYAPFRFVVARGLCDGSSTARQEQSTLVKNGTVVSMRAGGA